MIENIEFSLSYKNYYNLPLDKYNKNFTIYVNNKAYQTSRQIADLLSPNLCKLHFSDESVTEISIYTKEKEQKEVDYFQDFLSIPILQKCQIDLQHRIHYAEYFYLLGNYEEAINIQKENFKNITVDNAVDRLLFVIQTIEKIPYEYFEEINPLKLIITFISSHFDEIDRVELKKLPIEIIQLIIQNKSLKISNEYSLFSFILDLYNENRENAFLFEFVLFENIENEALDDFLNVFDTDYLTRPLWRKLKSIFLMSKKNKKRKKNNKTNDYSYRYTKNDSSSGSDSDSSFEDTLNNLNYMDPSFYGQPNFNNNQNDNRNNQQNNNRNRNRTRDSNQAPHANQNRNEAPHDLFFLRQSTESETSDDGLNRHDVDNRNSNNNDFNSSSTSSFEIDLERNVSDSDGDNFDDDDDDDDGGGFPLDEVVNFEFRRMGNILNGRYITKTVNCLYRIALIMDDICKQKIQHQILMPNSIIVDKNFKPNLNMIVSNNTNDTIEKTMIFDIFWAPEIIHNFVMTEKSDVYSFSIICFFMFTGFCPFHTLNKVAMTHMIETSRRDVIPESVPRPIRNLIEACWSQNPNLRPSFREIAAVLSDPSNQINGLDRRIFNHDVENDDDNNNDNEIDNTNDLNNENNDANNAENVGDNNNDNEINNTNDANYEENDNENNDENNAENVDNNNNENNDADNAENVGYNNNDNEINNTNDANNEENDNENNDTNDDNNNDGESNDVNNENSGNFFNNEI